MKKAIKTEGKGEGDDERTRLYGRNLESQNQNNLPTLPSGLPGMWGHYMQGLGILFLQSPVIDRALPVSCQVCYMAHGTSWALIQPISLQSNT